MRERELATARKEATEAADEARTARAEAERVRVFTDERDAAVADLTRQLVRVIACYLLSATGGCH